LLKDDPHHDPRPLERWLAAANLRICDDMPSSFNSPTMAIDLRFHADGPHYALYAMPLQLQQSFRVIDHAFVAPVPVGSFMFFIHLPHGRF
jgi:hypothetical protein